MTGERRRRKTMRKALSPTASRAARTVGDSRAWRSAQRRRTVRPRRKPATAPSVMPTTLTAAPRAKPKMRPAARLSGVPGSMSTMHATSSATKSSAPSAGGASCWMYCSAAVTARRAAVQRAAVHTSTTAASTTPATSSARRLRRQRCCCCCCFCCCFCCCSVVLGVLSGAVVHASGMSPSSSSVRGAGAERLSSLSEASAALVSVLAEVGAGRSLGRQRRWDSPDAARRSMTEGCLKKERGRKLGRVCRETDRTVWGWCRGKAGDCESAIWIASGDLGFFWSRFF